VAQNLGHIILMLALLVCSAFFSGSETAFFNLSRRQIQLSAKSRNRLDRLVALIMHRPGALLASLLFGNMLVNVLFFAVSSLLTVRLARAFGLTIATVAAVCAFALLVLFGEIFPKSFAYANSRTLSVFLSPAVYLAVKILSPAVAFFKIAVEEPVLRLMLGPARHPRPISTAEFVTLVEEIKRQGLITPDENKLLTETIELGYLKVHHVMCPRVDMVACDVRRSPRLACQLMMENYVTKIPVYDKTIDDIVGVVHLRRILLEPDAPLDKLVQQLHFVPEQKTVESLLEFFRRAQTDFAVVVDEYGGIAGSIRLENIAEELLGPIQADTPEARIESVGPLRYRLPGSVPVHDWADVFRINPDQMKIATIAGLVTALLGKIPQPGDVARVNNVRFTVERVEKNRIESVLLNIDPVSEDAD
jgi:putative hemolysin